MVASVEGNPPLFHRWERKDGTVERTQTKPESIVVAGINEKDMLALQGTRRRRVPGARLTRPADPGARVGRHDPPPTGHHGHGQPHPR
jgi:hypothetical protein